MKVTAEKTGNNTVKMEIKVDPEIFDKAMENSYIKARKRIVVPGFRKGKAPRRVIENYYGEAIFYEDAINEVCPQAYEDAVKETAIDPVDQPEIDIVQIGGGQEFVFTATVTVKPDVKLGQYKGIEVEKVEYNVTESDVEKQLKQIQEQNARWIAVEGRAVKDGDRITLDYSGSIDGELFEGGTAENQTLVIGSGQFIPGFEEQCIGMEINEEKDLEITFPEDYHVQDLKGKAATFHVKIHDIKEKELPVLDDEFAKDISEFDTFEEYKADLKKKMVERASEMSKAEMENQLITKVVANASVDIPDVMVERQIDTIVRDISFRLQYQGMNLDQYLKLMNTSIDDFRAQYKNESYNRVKTQLVLESISEVESIEATDEDLEKEYIKLADQYKRSVDDIKRDFESNVEYIKEGLIAQKTVDFLLQNANLIEKPEQEETTE